MLAFFRKILGSEIHVLIFSFNVQVMFREHQRASTTERVAVRSVDSCPGRDRGQIKSP